MSTFFHRKAVLLALLFSAAVWIVYTFFDYAYLHHGQIPFLTLLLSDISSHELSIRIIVILFFIIFSAILSYLLNKLEASETRLKNVYNNVIPICITDTDYNIINANKSYRKIFGPIRGPEGFMKCYDSRPGPKCKTEDCPLFRITQKGAAKYICESTKTDDGKDRHFIVTATPLTDNKNRQIGIIETFQDITPRRILEQEKENLIENLQDALAKVRVLSGFLPICASCKKIRDDKGYWTQIETYIRNHSEAEFSHGICPDCAEKLYGKFTKHDDGDI